MSRIKGILLQIWFLLTAPFHRDLVTHKNKTVHHINYIELKDRGITLLVFDLDDTLACWHTAISKEVLQLFQKIQNDTGLSIAILSNTTKKRMSYVMKDVIYSVS